MRIDEKFDLLKKKGEVALIVYLTAGFPTLKELMHNVYLLSENGADLIEVGVPFSDPTADGPTIQHASQVALKKNTCLKNILVELEKIKVDTPLILMSYFNPLLSYGKEKLFRDIKRSGVSGIIIPDLPVEEAREWIKVSNSSGIDPILLVSPTSTNQRIRLIAEYSRGFIYCVSTTGTTGMRDELPIGLLDFIQNIKSMTDKPVAVGFGISTPDHVRLLRDEADGVIVGSRIIEAIEKKEDLREIVRGLKEATKTSRK